MTSLLEQLLIVEEASIYTGYSDRHLRLLLETGKILGKKVGRDWVTTKEEIDKYLATNPKRGRKPKGLTK